MNILQVIASILLLFFLPGYTFINMLFPHKGELDLEYDQLYRVGLGMGMSIVIAILTGYILGYTALFYARYLWIVLINLTVIFFIAGYFRGGYPTIRKILGFEKDDRYDRLYMLEELLKKRRKIIKKIEELSKLTKLSPHGERYKKEMDELIEEVKKMDRRIDELKEALDEI